ncbi:C1 family peptidase [Halomonas maura]|uniref:C1 family peptidase n=1 Tax=Halomonas maura TaxID=117606 RepID=UPI0025B393B9|nr:C1 family peptidase [Halomonas maura]MDN3557432.1 C1 family peptidase [Halomonas maura]
MPGHPPAAALNVVADAPDFRDRFYTPSLRPLREAITPPQDLYILDQGQQGACTGFGLAATINLLYRFQRQDHKVSPRMLYELARRYDEWPGEDYEGSSCRGAIKGWRNSGVCLEQLAPFRQGQRHFAITPEMAGDARQRTLGAYYRLRPEITDFHAALNEVGVIYVSARVHRGWYQPVADEDGEAHIPESPDIVGGHAFAIVGYNRKGFWVQNSWGRQGWGQGGLALWPYADWARHVLDAWVVQLALPTPQIFAERAGDQSAGNRLAARGSVPRQKIENHFVHLDDGAYHDKGRYWSNRQHMALVQHRLKQRDFEHLLLYAHGGLNSTQASARRIAAMQGVFLANGIYPFHVMYDTGLVEELRDVILGKRLEAERVAGDIRDWLDRRIEDLTRKVGRALWREMKFGARQPFGTQRADGSDALGRLLAPLDGEIPLHVVGHSTGAILHAHLLTRAATLLPDLEIRTCSLLAPAATNALFEQRYVPLLEHGHLKELCIYNLSDRLERDDHVAEVYGKSLLYLVSRAFEEAPTMPLLGMQVHNSRLDLAGLPVEFVYSEGEPSQRSASLSHGGFDNDPSTLNDVLRRILGKAPARPFVAEELDY